MTTYCRGGLNPPDNTPKGVFVDVFGRKHSAPTVDGNLSLMAMRQILPLRWVKVLKETVRREGSNRSLQFTKTA